MGSDGLGGEFVGDEEEGLSSGAEGEVGETRLGSSSGMGGEVDGASVIRGGPENNKTECSSFNAESAFSLLSCSYCLLHD